MKNKLPLILCCFVFLFSFQLYGQDPCQEITATITSTSPASDPVDSIIKICKGESVNFTGTATFSNNGNNATYSWKFSDGTQQNGTTAVKSYPDEGVYVVDFIVTDEFGCTNSNCNNRAIVHVSTTPEFEISNPDTICIFTDAHLSGEPIPQTGQYNCAPPIADTTFLPDGSGVSYTTSIEVSCFTSCDTVEVIEDLESICINMEHSYMGDLDWKIICPNGQSTSLKDYSSGGGGTILGEPVATNLPVDGSNLLDPGIGYTYCFSPTSNNGYITDNANWTNVSPYTDPLGNVSTGNIFQANAGTYEADGNWENLIGCPLNGDWTIEITDHLNLDNGYIFYWEINFARDLDNYSFTPEYKTHTWAGPNITDASDDGKNITIHPTSEGLSCYTFSVVDEFNCPYDTTVCLFVIDPGNPGTDSSVNICLNQGVVNMFDYLGGYPEGGGTWSGSSSITEDGNFNPNQAGIGNHELTYTKRKWECENSATVFVKVLNDVEIDFTWELKPGCTEDTVIFSNLSEDGKYFWNFGDDPANLLEDDTNRHPIHIYQNQDQYSVRLIVETPFLCQDTIIKAIDITHPLIAQFEHSTDSVCQDGSVPVNFTNSSTGATVFFWDFGDGNTSTEESPSHTYELAGEHQIMLVINDDIPCFDTAYSQIYVDSIYDFTILADQNIICKGDEINFNIESGIPYVIADWNFDDGTEWTEKGSFRTRHSFTQENIYWPTVTMNFPVCESVTYDLDSIIVHNFPVVDLGKDSALCLDGNPIYLKNLNHSNSSLVKYKWNTGDTSAEIKITQEGLYTLSATIDGCTTKEEIIIKKDCYTNIPNAFTPNGDGENDYFYPRQLLTEGVSNFSMVITNRWGQKVFETNTIAGRGWDGKFNDQDQPIGVYVYQITLSFKNGRKENYTGNVTLIR